MQVLIRRTRTRRRDFIIFVSFFFIFWGGRCVPESVAETSSSVGVSVGGSKTKEAHGLPQRLLARLGAGGGGAHVLEQPCCVGLCYFKPQLRGRLIRADSMQHTSAYASIRQHTSATSNPAPRHKWIPAMLRRYEGASKALLRLYEGTII